MHSRTWLLRVRGTRDPRSMLGKSALSACEGGRGGRGGAILLTSISSVLAERTNSSLQTNTKITGVRAKPCVPTSHLGATCGKFPRHNAHNPITGTSAPSGLASASH